MSEEREALSGPPIQDLNVEQLRALAKQINDNIAQLSQSINQLELASAKYKESKKAVLGLAAAKVNDPIMAPLTTSMYIPAKINNTETVTIELGSGYFVKKTLKGASEFFQRKIAFVDNNAEQIERQMMNARNNLERVHAMINLRVRQQTQQAPQASPA